MDFSEKSYAKQRFRAGNKRAGRPKRPAERVVGLVKGHAEVNSNSYRCPLPHEKWQQHARSSRDPVQALRCGWQPDLVSILVLNVQCCLQCRYESDDEGAQDGTVPVRSQGADFEELLQEADRVFAQASYRHRELRSDIASVHPTLASQDPQQVRLSVHSASHAIWHQAWVPYPPAGR